MKPSVLVCCASNWASPARLPRVLSRAGFWVSVLSARDHYLARTRYVDQVIGAPADVDGYVDALRAHLAEVSYRRVFITDDPLLAALAARRDEPWLEGVLPMTGAWASALASKAHFTELAAGAGLPVADSHVCASLEGARRAAHDLGWPVMLKQSSGYAGLGVRLAHSDEELSAAWPELAGDLVVVQRFIEGPIGNSVVLFHRGAPICWMSAFKVRTWPGPFGPSSARRFMTHPEVEPLLRKVGTLTQYHGFAAVDWVLDGDGHLRVIELNARPVPTIHMGPLAGVDFARALRESLAGTPTVHAPPDPPADAPVYPMFPEDVYRAAAEDNLSIASWLPVPGRFTDLPWQDPPLLWHHLRSFLRAAREAQKQAQA
jgi:predicted ATP-grasp superfamily ATP-dependent carboligase